MIFISYFISGILSSCKNNSCVANSLLPIGSQIVSRNGKYTLKMLMDGNMVINCGNGTIWTSDTANIGVKVMNFQSDGNVVLQMNNGSIVWQTEKKGRELKIEDDGKLVLYGADNVSVWSPKPCSKCSGTES